MTNKPGELAETIVADGVSTPGAAASSEPAGAASGDAIGGGPAAGTLLASRWELLALLGVGGMGSVYRARDRELDELVALKVLRSDLAHAPGMLERFRREVKLARRVTHPNVARTFDIGEDRELRFLTMELVDGAPLGRLIAKPGTWLPLERLVTLGRAICAGLDAAHEAGVIHRDLKPDNVLVERSGRVVITDFGIARAVSGGERPAGDTQGLVVGTPLYMAPEQVAHDAPIGPPTDVYALGCMLFELATCAPPWHGPNALAIAAARLAAGPPDARARARHVGDGLAELLQRMMARDPSGRPQRAGEVGGALAALLATEGARSSGTSSGSLVPLAPASRGPSSAPSTPGRGLPSVAQTWVAPKTLAVLPIELRGADGDAYLAAALTDDLVDLLSATPGLRVRPRAVAERVARSADGGAGAPRDPRDVGRELDVQVVVTGEVRRHGDVLRAGVRLITVEDGFQLWAGRFTKSPADFFEIGDEAAAAIAGALVSRPLPPRDAPDAEALDLYLRGRYLMRRMWGSGEEAVDVLRVAFERAPSDPRIRLSFARALVRALAMGGQTSESADTAFQLIDEALAVDPRSGEARLARAALHLMRGEWVAAAADLRSSIEIDPEGPEALASLGDVLVDAGAPTAAQFLERAIELDPEYLTPRVALMRFHALGGDPSRAREALGHVPRSPYDRASYWVSRARLAMWARDRADAEVVRATFLDAETPPLIQAVVLATTSATLGEPPVWDIASAPVPGMDGRVSPRIATFQAQFRCEVVATFGDHGAALAALRSADAQGTFDVRWIESCPAIEPLRALPDFIDVRERVALRAERVRAALGELATVGRRG